MQNLIGKTISHYKILQKLGSGGMGIVYKARDRILKRLIALKTLKFEQDDPRKIDKYRKRMMIEAQSVAKLKHPNIVTIFDISTEEIMTYIAMEFIDGYPLSDIINPGGFCPTKPVSSLTSTNVLLSFLSKWSALSVPKLASLSPSLS